MSEDILLLHRGSSPSDSAHPSAPSTANAASVELGIWRDGKRAVSRKTLAAP